MKKLRVFRKYISKLQIYHLSLWEQKQKIMQKHILAAQQAPKYALTSNQFGFPLYISDTEKTNGSPITDKIEDALMFSMGFDNPIEKIAYWGFVTGYALVAIEVQ